MEQIPSMIYLKSWSLFQVSCPSGHWDLWRFTHSHDISSFGKIQTTNSWFSYTKTVLENIHLTTIYQGWVVYKLVNNWKVGSPKLQENFFFLNLLLQTLTLQLSFHFICSIFKRSFSWDFCCYVNTMEVDGISSVVRKTLEKYILLFLSFHLDYFFSISRSNEYCWQCVRWLIYSNQDTVLVQTSGWWIFYTTNKI